MSAGMKGKPLGRFAAAVADLGDPFYDEERQRDVWNEASAFGFQLMLWGNLSLAAALLWIQGGDALGAAYALIVIAGLASVLAITYARQLGVEVGWSNVSRSRARLIVLGTVVVALVGGFARVVVTDADTGLGFLAGILVVLAAVGLPAWWKARSGRRAPSD